ncbi:DUF2750 domain-containing protein [Neisseria elongata]|jgi:hypothetical protein|uniref:DUF2750 domain-containing protein n=1 Tax=Neisseria elongata TaxID=495 RepID=UPI000E0D7E56|nr:DUF2750 domain-containing protein [Neisseria elongata]
MFPQPEDEEYNRFIRSIIGSQTLYTLVSDEGDIAECPSTEYEEDDGEPVPVFCVWHDRTQAEACKVEEWADYQLEALPLDFFLHEWLVSMDQDAVLLGVDFDSELYGLEIEPVEVLADLLDAAAQMQCGDMIDGYDELMKYRLEWEREMAGQSRLN